MRSPLVSSVLPAWAVRTTAEDAAKKMGAKKGAKKEVKKDKDGESIPKKVSTGKQLKNGQENGWKCNQLGAQGMEAISCLLNEDVARGYKGFLVCRVEGAN